MELPGGGEEFTWDLFHKANGALRFNNLDEEDVMLGTQKLTKPNGADPGAAARARAGR